MVFLHRAEALRDLVRVKDEDQRAAAVALVVAQQVHEHVPRGIEAGMGELLELVPGEDDVVAVDQQEIVRRADGFEELALVLAAEHHLRQHVAAADGAVGAPQRSPAAPFPAPARRRGDGTHDALRRRLDRAAEAQQRQVGRVVHVLPFDLIARAVAAEDGARRVFQIRAGS